MGRPRKSDAELAATGSANASRRRAAAKREAARRQAKKASRIRSTLGTRPLPSTPREWTDLLKSLPGYDPFALARGYVFDEARARKAIEWIESNVRHLKGPRAGQPFVLERWQRALVANLFGWIREGTSLRRFREVLLYVGKKNGKTLMCAGLALYLFLQDGEAAPEVYCAAAKREQAKILWSDCVSQLKRMDPDELLADRYQHSVASKDGGFLKPISADAGTEDGMNPSAAMIDELHRQPDDGLVNVIRLSTAARSQPVVIMLTTADEDREGSVCNATLERAKAVRDNPGDPTKPGHDPEFLPAIYEASVEDDWTRVETWRKANPNLGVSIQEEFLAKRCAEAKENPAMLPDFLRYHLNVRSRGTGRKLFPDMTLWDRCGAAIDLPRLVGRACIAGVDLSSTTDITAIVLVFPSVAPEPIYVLGRYWVPEEASRRRDLQNDRTYATWARMDPPALRLTQGNQLDDERILEEMTEFVSPYRVREVAIDPYNSLRYTQPLMRRGFEVVHVRQGWATLSEPAKYLSTLVGNVAVPGRQTLSHGGDPVLRWMAGNTELEVDKKGNWGLVKPRGSAKIDGIAALVTALARVVVATPQATGAPTVFAL